MGPLARIGGEENDCSLLAATMDSKIMRIAIVTLTRSSHDVFAPEIVRRDVRVLGRSRALIWQAAHANPDEATPASHSSLFPQGEAHARRRPGHSYNKYVNLSLSSRVWHARHRPPVNPPADRSLVSTYLRITLEIRLLLSIRHGLPVSNIYRGFHSTCTLCLQ